MATNTAQGSFIEVGADDTGAIDIGSDTMSEVGTVTSIGGPQTEKGEVDSTHLRSTARESLPDLPDNGSCQLEILLDEVNATHATLDTDANTAGQQVRNWRINEPSGATRSFKGYVQSWTINRATASMITASCSIRISGSVTRTAPP